jgi:RES domain-containing protein
MPRVEEAIGQLTNLDMTAYWSGPDEVFDLDSLVTAETGDRWNAPDEPTIYLSGDAGLTLIECGRHETGVDGGLARAIWSVRIRADRILDLRSADVRRALDLDDDNWFLDRETCRGVARRLRQSGRCAGLLVPSAGLPDDLERWNLVLFADRLDAPLDKVISEPRATGSLRCSR